VTGATSATVAPAITATIHVVVFTRALAEVAVA